MIDFSAMQQLPSQLINEITKYHSTQKEQLDRMKLIQSELLLHSQGEGETFTILNDEQNTLKKQIENELTSLREVENLHILSPYELHQVAYLTNQLTIQKVQLELFQEELRLSMCQQESTPRALYVYIPSIITTR